MGNTCQLQYYPLLGQGSGSTKNVLDNFGRFKPQPAMPLFNLQLMTFTEQEWDVVQLGRLL